MERDRLIAEVAKEAGVSLDRADPLLAAATINRVLLEEALAELQRGLREAEAEASNAVIERLREETAKAQRAGRIALRAAWAAAGIGGVPVAATAGFWLATITHG
jgi:hypothetical protein